MLKIAPHQLLLTMLFTLSLSFIALAASFAEAPPVAEAAEVADGQLD